MCENISAAAKARGATGFLHQARQWKIEIVWDGSKNVLASGNTRNAGQLFASYCKEAAHPHSAMKGATVRLICDGVEIKNNQSK